MSWEGDGEDVTRKLRFLEAIRPLITEDRPAQIFVLALANCKLSLKNIYLLSFVRYC